MAKRDLLTDGLLIETSNGNAIQNPIVGIANKAMSDMVRFAAELVSGGAHAMQRGESAVERA
jgi:phage terminase small subunit